MRVDMNSSSASKQVELFYVEVARLISCGCADINCSVPGRFVVLMATGGENKGTSPDMPFRCRPGNAPHSLTRRLPQPVNLFPFLIFLLPGC